MCGIAKKSVGYFAFCSHFSVCGFLCCEKGVLFYFFFIFAIGFVFMIKKRFLIVYIFLLFAAGTVGQVADGSFLPPFDFKHFLSGNFGELRSNHFHAGLDFKTQGVAGKPIRVVADGYIVRAKVQYGGYGRALYVAHDNGRMTVYGHLDRFPAYIEREIREEQYRCESYPVDIAFEPGRFKVKRGEILAYAGNSGYSFGPHLHFEVRSLDGNELYNPLLFYKSIVDDDRPPVAQAVAFYPREGQGVLNGGSLSLVRKVVNGAVCDTLTAWGKIGFGIKAVDYMSGTHNKYGVYEIELFVDDSLHFSSRMDNVAFDENRLINAWADYDRLAGGEGWFLRSFLLENNPLRALNADAARGWVNVCEERLYKVEYRLRDYHGNSSSCLFAVRGVRSEPPVQPLRGYYHLRWCLTNEIAGGDFSLTIPRGALFDDVRVAVKESFSAAGSPVYIFGDKKTPLWGSAKLTIKIPSHLLPFAEKCYIERVTAKGGSAVGGKSADGYVTADVFVLDSYAVAVDTVAPLLRPVKEKEWGRKGRVVFSLADKGCGLDSYKCYIDGRFVLFEYSSKSGRLACDLRREKVSRGKHTLKVVATDRMGNSVAYETNIKY